MKENLKKIKNKISELQEKKDFSELDLYIEKVIKNSLEEDYDEILSIFKELGISIEIDEDKKDSEYSIDNYSGLSIYLKEISSYQLLTAAEEKKLFIQYQNSFEQQKKAIRDKIITSNLKLVVSIAKQYFAKYAGKYCDYMDVVSFGNEGLFKAIDKFDVNKEFKFSTYATLWIRQSITRNLFACLIVRSSVATDALFSRIKRYKDTVYKKTGKEPSEEEICKEFGISRLILTDLTMLNEGVISLHVPYDNDPASDGSCSLINLIPSSDNVERVVDGQMNYDKILSVIDNMHKKGVLNDNEYFVFMQRKINGKTLEKIAKELNLTRERIRQIEGKGTRKIIKMINRLGI